MRFTVGQLAKVYNISSQAIHGYVDMGILPCVRDDNGYRYFDEYGFQILGTIIKNRNIGFPLKESNYVYQKSNLIEILHRLNEQEQKANDEMMHLMIQLQQLDNDKFLIQRALLQKDIPVLIDMDKIYRYKLGDDTQNITDLIKEDSTAVSLWYSNLFYTQSSLVLNYEDSHINGHTFCLMTSNNNYHGKIDYPSNNLEIVEKGKAISVMTIYKNEVSFKLLESLINTSLVKYPEYCIKSEPFTRLVTSFSDELCEKVNVIELVIPVKKGENSTCASIHLIM